MMNKKSLKKYQPPTSRVIPLAVESALLTGNSNTTGPSANFIDDPDIADEE